MIEIRSFDGSPQELSDLCVSAWKRRYEGRMPVPLWSADFLEWQLLADNGEQRDFVVAAYDGSKLVGLLPARAVDFQLEGEPVRGTWGSFFSVDPDYENEGVSLKLNLELRRRHRDRGAQVSMGFVYLGSSLAMGKEFWLRQRSMKVVREVGMWARLIDHRAVAEFEFSRRDRWGARLLGVFQRRPRPIANTTGIRPFQRSDLADCLRLADKLSRSAEFGYVWNEASLLRQMSYRDVSRTLVAEVEGTVRGFVTYCKLDVLGRRTITTGVIDLIALDELSPIRQKELLQAALHEMAEAGCHVAMMLRVPERPKRPLLAAGFIPQPKEYCYVAQSMGKEVFKSPVDRLHVHWR